MHKAVFFDLDNTLEDWAPARKAARERIAEYANDRFGVDKKRFINVFHNVEYSFVGNSLKPSDYNRTVWLEAVFRKLGIKASRTTIKEMEKLYWEAALKKIRLIPGAKDFLKRAGKYKRILITDSDGYSGNYIKNRKIRILGIREYFDRIITSADVGRNKPDKRMWRKGLREFNLKGSECVMIGDKPEMDLKPAKELGMTTVWFDHGLWSEMRKGKKFNYVDYTVKKFSQLKKILK